MPIKIDWNQLIMPIVNGVLIPEIMAFIKQYYFNNNELPTETILREALSMNVKEGLSLWDTWNLTHPK